MRTNTTGISVKSGLRGGKLATNHSRAAKYAGLAVKTGLRGGKIATNHSVTLLCAR